MGWLGKQNHPQWPLTRRWERARQQLSLDEFEKQLVYFAVAATGTQAIHLAQKSCMSG
jgi:hypothetical protein